jgi:predicted nuclease of predicted toxin-antitoxin system
VRFKIDQNLPVEIAEELRAAGHDAETVDEEGLGGTLDPQLAGLARSETRALVTLDLGLGDIRRYPPAEYHGLVVLRPPSQDKPTVLRVFVPVIPLLDQEPLDGHLWIVDERRVRIRR